MPRLSLVVPTYNESETLTRLVEGVGKALGGADFELIIVDDASPDGTGEVADALAAERPWMRVLHRPGKAGRGTAMVAGMEVATGDILGIMDADLQHPADLLPVLLDRALGGVDVVVASRYVKGGGAAERSAARSVVSRGALWLSHLFLPQTRSVMDTQSGYFMFWRRVVDGVTLDVRGFTALVEVLGKGRVEKVEEVPYTFAPRAGGKSKLGTLEIVRYVGQLLRLSDYRVFKFMAVGASGLIVNNGALWGLAAAAGWPPWYAAPVAIEVSILTNFVLNDRWTFRGRGDGQAASRVLRYHGSVAMGAGVNYAALLLLLWLGLELIVANTVGIVLGFVSNYVLSETFVWRHSGSGGGGAQS